MGQPSLGIYVTELLAEYGVKTLIRVGTSGGLSDKLKLRDIVIASAASTDSAMNRDVFGPYNFAPVADFGLLRRGGRPRHGTPPHLARRRHRLVGPLLSPRGAPRFTTPCAPTAFWLSRWNRPTLYTLAARYGARAVSICSVSDNIVTGDKLKPEERQSSLSEMVELSLEVAIAG